MKLLKTIWREFWTGRKGVRFYSTGWYWAFGLALEMDWQPEFDWNGFYINAHFGPWTLELYLEDID